MEGEVVFYSAEMENLWKEVILRSEVISNRGHRLQLSLRIKALGRSNVCLYDLDCTAWLMKQVKGELFVSKDDLFDLTVLCRKENYNKMKQQDREGDKLYIWNVLHWWM